MLVLTRKINEGIRIGENIELLIVQVRGSGENAQVRIGIRAPESVRILRKEIYDDVMAENIRAVSEGSKLFALVDGHPIGEENIKVDLMVLPEPPSKVSDSINNEDALTEQFVPQFTPGSSTDDIGLLYDTVEYLQAMGKYHEALQAVSEGVNRWPDYTDFHFVMGNIYLQLGKIREAEQAFMVCLEKGEMPEGVRTLKGVGSFLAHYNLGMIYEMQKAADKASLHYCEAARAGYPFAELRAGLLGKSCHL